MIVDTLVFDESQITSKTNRSDPQWGGPCHTLHGNADRAVIIIKEEPIVFRDDITIKLDGGVLPSRSEQETSKECNA